MPTRSKNCGPLTISDFEADLQTFCEFGELTRTKLVRQAGVEFPVFENEFWTSGQRSGHRIHEISYRACYKPQLPAFFINRFCETGATVYDPFMGRGTTLIEAQLGGCRAIGNDSNPLCRRLIAPRLKPPRQDAVERAIEEVVLPEAPEIDETLLAFYHPDTLREIAGWKQVFAEARDEGDPVLAWLEMIALNRLTGHSSGFFSVYTLPPNQAVTADRQLKINEQRNQIPPYRDTRALMLKKSKYLLGRDLPEDYGRDESLLLAQSADRTPEIADDSVDLVVTSPPFLDTVDYAQDNWLRLWFSNIEIDRENLWQIRSAADWAAKMSGVFKELRRVLKDDGLIAFEVGEVRKGSVKLEESVIEAAVQAGLIPQLVVINTQEFTKTANCWGVANNKKGTNSNRIVLLGK
ncbi:MAG: DNA methyltransferase [Verrucomicrobiota bacterium]